MGRTACTEPQCLYSTPTRLLPLWAVRPVQSLSACTMVHFTLLFYLLTCRIWWAPNNASKGQMGFNSAFKGLKLYLFHTNSMEQSPSWEASRFSASQKFYTMYGTRRFITAFKSDRHLSLSWASSIQSLTPHPTAWTSILLLSSHLRLGLPCGLFPSGFISKNYKIII